MVSLIERTSKRQAAEARQADRNNRDPQTQLTQLDLRLGKDVGAKKERKRLLTQLNESQDNRNKAVTRRGRRNKKGGR